VYISLLHTFLGAAGGLGGNGGPGGRGGSSGNVCISPKELETAFQVAHKAGDAGKAGGVVPAEDFGPAAFRALCHVTCQPYGASTTGAAGAAPPPSNAVLRIETSMDWMAQVFHDISAADDKRPLIQSLLLSYAALSLSFTAPIAFDAYHKSLRYVPWIPSASAFEKTLADFEIVERWYNESAAMLSGQGAQRDALQKRIDGAHAMVARSAEEIERLKKNMADLAETFKAAVENVSEARKQLMGAKGALKSEIGHHVDCKVDTVLDALSSALMFTDVKVQLFLYTLHNLRF